MKYQKMNKVAVVISFSLLVLAPPVFSNHSSTPDLLLASVYKKRSDISRYWVSEKLDGVRAFWNGQQFVSRQGNVYQAPAWFTAGFPEQPLDGELWIARGHFEQLLSTVTKDNPIDEEWQQVSYQVFELPNGKGLFSERIDQMRALVEHSKSPYLKLVQQRRASSHESLMRMLDEVVAANAEGLMLHRENAYYQTGRSQALLKVKRYQDAEARVIKYIRGKGKYTGMMGALLLETPEGVRFKVGSGFSDLERQNPPKIGDVVTYKYFGKTKRGKPRFASFLRLRAVQKE